MHLFLSLWCAILSFTTAQELPGSTRSSTNAAVPWITYTSTRSCTTQPSTVFVYTSNSTTFLLPQPGPNSAITPLNPNAVSHASDTSISAASNDGVATGAEDTTQASSGISGSLASATGSDNPSATSSSTVATAQDAPSGTITSDLALTPFVSPSSSTTSRRALGAGFSAGNGPRSGTQDLSSILTTSTTTSSVPSLVKPGSTCPLPSTITVSATLSDASCATFEKTVTSYIMASCPVPSGAPETQTLVQSGRTSYITRTRQMTRPIVITYTTIESGTTAYKTSIQERNVTQSQVSTLDRVTETLVFTTFQDGSTIYRTSFLERTPTPLPTAPTAMDDGLGSTFVLLQIFLGRILVDHMPGDLQRRSSDNRHGSHGTEGGSVGT